MRRISLLETMQYASAISWCLSEKHKFTCHIKLAELLNKEFMKG